MRILHITPYFYPAWAYGGTPRVVFELCKKLAKRDHEVTVFTTDVLDKQSRFKKKKQPVKIEGCRVFYFKNLSNSLAYNYKLPLPFGMLAAFVRGTEKFDIIHLHEYRTVPNALTFYFATRLKVPYVLSAHGSVLPLMGKYFLKECFDKFVGQKILKNATILIAESEIERKQYVKIGLSSRKTKVIPWGIDFENFQKLPAKGKFKNRFSIKQKKIILFLGRINAIKGLNFLIESFVGISKKPYREVALVIAGSDDGYLKEAQTLVRRHGISKETIFPGFLNDRDKLSAYVDADVLVYPSRFEIFGLVPLEALLCETPVIVTSTCGCSDIIEKTKAGYLVKYGNVKQLERTLLNILENQSEAKRRAALGAKYIKNNLNWSEITEQFVNIYRGLQYG